jgi:hypothetical protein
MHAVVMMKRIAEESPRFKARIVGALYWLSVPIPRAAYNNPDPLRYMSRDTESGPSAIRAHHSGI